MLTFRRPRTPIEADHLVPASPRASAAPVTVAESLERFAQPLRQLLGPAFEVTVDHPAEHGVALLPAQGIVALAYWRQRFPSASLLIVARVGGGLETEAASYLDAAADAYLIAPTPPLVAAHVSSLHRRTMASQGELAPSPQVVA